MPSSPVDPTRWLECITHAWLCLLSGQGFTGKTINLPDFTAFLLDDTETFNSNQILGKPFQAFKFNQTWFAVIARQDQNICPCIIWHFIWDQNMHLCIMWHFMSMRGSIDAQKALKLDELDELDDVTAEVNATNRTSSMWLWVDVTSDDSSVAFKCMICRCHKYSQPKSMPQSGHPVCGFELLWHQMVMQMSVNAHDYILEERSRVILYRCW